MKALLGVGAAVVLLVVIFSRGGDDGATDEPGSETNTAALMCEEFVNDVLKAPATAEYGGVSEAQVTYSGGTYTVKNHVDSENGFGAMLRSNFTCKIRSVGNDEWRLVDLSGIN